MVEKTCGSFDKHCQWGNEPTVCNIAPIERRIRYEKCTTSGNRPRNAVVEGHVGGTIVNELATCYEI